MSSVTITNAGTGLVQPIQDRAVLPSFYSFKPTLVQVSPLNQGYQYNLSIGFSNLLYSVFVNT